MHSNARDGHGLKGYFWLDLFYRKIGTKMTFDFEDPENPVDLTF